MIRKHVAKFGSQRDKYLAGVIWAYRNTLHEATQEKPSFLLFGAMCMHACTWIVTVYAQYYMKC